MKSILEKEYRINSDKIFILYKGVENQLIDQENINKTSNHNSILFVKSDFERGGLLILIQALNIIKKNINLTVIGPEIKFHDQIIHYWENSGLLMLKNNQPQEIVYQEMKQFMTKNHLNRRFGIIIWSI